MRRLNDTQTNHRNSSYNRPRRLTVPERSKPRTRGGLISDFKASPKQIIKSKSSTIAVKPQLKKPRASAGQVNFTKMKKSTLAKPTLLLKKKVNPQNSAAKPKKTTAKKIYHRHLARAAKKAEALEKALLKRKLSLPKSVFNKKKMLGVHLPVVIAASFVLLAGYIMLDSWMINNQVKDELADVVKNQNVNASSRQVAEGKDESEPDKASFGRYKVAPDLPRMIRIDKLRVTARVLPMSVNPDNSMQAPVNVFDAGWYTGSVKPGQKGVAVINGHASGPTRGGLFAYLNTLEVGDKIQIERGDGSKLDYEVVKKDNKKLDDVDMTKVMTLANGVDEGMNLITCGGEYLKDKKTYSERDIIFTKRIK